MLPCSSWLRPAQHQARPPKCMMHVDFRRIVPLIESWGQCRSGVTRNHKAFSYR